MAVLYREERIAIFVLIASLVGGIFYLASRRFPEALSASIERNPPLSLVQVTVLGAVEHPGEYRLPRGAGAREAAMLAEPKKGARLDLIPRGEPLAAGSVVYVPAGGESAADAARTREYVLKRIRRPRQLKRIDINSASRDELASIPGVGEKTAEAIILERSKAPFLKLADLTRVAGIGERKLHMIRDYVTVAPGGR